MISPLILFPGTEVSPRSWTWRRETDPVLSRSCVVHSYASFLMQSIFDRSPASMTAAELLEAGAAERVAPSLASEQKRRIRVAMIAISAVAVALACTVVVLSSKTDPAPVAGACCARLAALRECGVGWSCERLSHG